MENFEKGDRYYCERNV